MPSVLTRARGRLLAVVITRCTVMSTGASAFTRNAYHGLGLIGSFSGVISTLKSCGPICVHAFRRAPLNWLSKVTVGAGSAKTHVRRS